MFHYRHGYLYNLAFHIIIIIMALQFFSSNRRPCFASLYFVQLFQTYADVLGENDISSIPYIVSVHQPIVVNFIFKYSLDVMAHYLWHFKPVIGDSAVCCSLSSHIFVSPPTSHRPSWYQFMQLGELRTPGCK